MQPRIFRLVVCIFCTFVFSQFVGAEETEKKDPSTEPWERAALYLGAFIVDANSDLSLGIQGAGLPKVTIDAEDLLGLDENFTVFRADAFWRITRRNRVDFTYYQMNRDGSTFIGIDIPEFPIGDRVKTDFDISILRGSYAWSFFKNEHFDLAVAGGLYGMSIDYKMRSEDSGTIEETDFTVPLPVVGLRGNFALTPKWFIRQSFDYFYVNIGDYEGQLVDFGVALEWNAFKYLGLGVGYNFVAMDLKYSGSDDFLDEIDMSYGGVQAFAKLYF